MVKNKTKKLIRFLEGYKNSAIGKAAQEQIKRIERVYDKHRAKSAKK